MDRQALTGDTVLVKSREMTGQEGLKQWRGGRRGEAGGEKGKRRQKTKYTDPFGEWMLSDQELKN